MENELTRAVGEWLPQIERALDAACQFDDGCPETLAAAIRYAVLAPGKRLRPALVLMAADACGGSIDAALPGAVAVELIHAYSLIHDDLPAMDDDDLRRGRPTVHVQFDEATAILAGDALQPMAFAQLCRLAPPDRIAEAVRVLSEAAGPSHLVGGQVDDLAAEAGRLPFGGPDGSVEGEGVAFSNEPAAQTGRNDALTFLELIHRRKTGALFAASLDLGAVISGASRQQRDSLSDYAANVGLAFQVVDDLLDHTADESEMGKRVGKDLERGKLTYPGLIGVDGARRRADDLIERALESLNAFGDAGWRLELLARYVSRRSR
ncbi:MAG: polyprenyl synthetase family protein [Planctomycetota bacterium]